MEKEDEVESSEEEESGEEEEESEEGEEEEEEEEEGGEKDEEGGIEVTQTTVSHSITKTTRKSRTIITNNPPEDLFEDTKKAPLFGKDLSEYDDVDVDALLEQLSPEELDMLAGEVDPDDSLIPPSDRCGYKCAKDATGPLDRKKLINHINEQAINEPDRPESVPFVAGVIRGKVYVPPPPPVTEDDDDDLVKEQVEVDIDTEFDNVLNKATEDEIVDLAAILGFHSMMNQEQYHASLLNKGRPQGMGWGGITKATKFKALPAEPPNETDPEDSIKKLKADDVACKELNFNNIRTISDEQIARLFATLENNTKLENLSMANTGLSDRHLDTLCAGIASNNTVKVLNLETNSISPSGIVRILEAINKMHSIEEIRLANQRQSVLGNKIEMQLTELIEANNTLLRVGVAFEFNDARNRVSRQLQKNLDTFRERRIGHKSKNNTVGLTPLPFFLRMPLNDDDDEYGGYYSSRTPL